MAGTTDFFAHLEDICDRIPVNIYWADANGVILGVNRKVLESIGAMDRSEIIGKTVFDVYPKEIAENVWQHAKDVIASKQEIVREHQIKELHSGVCRYFSDTMSPVIDDTGIPVGVVGTSVEITAQKESEILKLDNERYKIRMEENQKVLKFLENTLQSFQSFKMEMLNNKIGVESKLPKFGSEIKLTKREREILYFLSLNKSPKEIASILSTIENKQLSPLTISSIIDKQLYIKFNVNNVGRLIEVANELKLIPFLIS